MKTDFKKGDRVELLATIIDHVGKSGRKVVVDERGTIDSRISEFTYHVKVDGEPELIACFAGDLQLLNAADLLAESLNDDASDRGRATGST